MLGSGAALGLFATLATTGSALVQRVEMVGPAACFVGAMVGAALALWTRIQASLKLTYRHGQFSIQLGNLKSEIENQYRTGTLGKVPPPQWPQSPPFPEAWISALDILLAISGLAFVLGVGWSTINLIL